jgi:hypothetical protein
MMLNEIVEFLKTKLGYFYYKIDDEYWQLTYKFNLICWWLLLPIATRICLRRSKYHDWNENQRNDGGEAIILA